MESPRLLSPRDAKALRWIGEQYICRVDQLAVLLGLLRNRRPLTPAAAYQTAARWDELGLVKRGRIVANEREWVWLTPKGLRQAGLAFGGWEPTPWTARHMGMVNHVRLFVEPRRPGARWRPERELRAARTDRRHTDGAPIPDAELIDPGGNVIAIEVELTRQIGSAGRSKMAALVARYDAVWYFAAADCWAAVHDAVCAVPPHLADIVRLYALEDL